jgi:hypothetical protein
MRIIVKSTPENFIKEKSGAKPCTVRKLDGKDTIEIINAETGELAVRTITDITVWDGRIIISFREVIA